MRGAASSYLKLQLKCIPGRWLHTYRFWRVEATDRYEMGRHFAECSGIARWSGRLGAGVCSPREEAPRGGSVPSPRRGARSLASAAQPTLDADGPLHHRRPALGGGVVASDARLCHSGTRGSCHAPAKCDQRPQRRSQGAYLWCGSQSAARARRRGRGPSPRPAAAQLGEAMGRGALRRSAGVVAEEQTLA
jgi:hypothetical protein